jgi:beta-mannosidase
MRLRLDGWDAGETASGDDTAFTTRTTLTAPADGELVFDGLATLCTVVVDGEVAARSESMWVPVRIPVRAGEHTVEVRCEPLTPRLAERRKPRARWRQKVAYDGNLRWFRTTLLGRAPGFAPGPPVVGLWRPAWFVAGEPTVSVRCRVDGADGVVSVRSSVDGEFAVGEAVLAMKAREWGELRVPGVRLWWPHTHGEPHLYDATFTPTALSDRRNPTVGEHGSDGATVGQHGWRRRIGFRTVEANSGWLRDGLTLSLNAIPLFVRGALWTPVPEGEERTTLEAARDAGLNAIRLPGTGVYESPAFHDLCDELGLLVWQDLMFANLDYPFDVPEFRAQVEAELDALADTVGGRPSLAVVCGGSEVEQQVAMLGLDPALGRPPLLADRLDLDAVWVPNAPCGAERPLRADDGVAHWFGVGGYRRPLSDARSAGVRFAAECLALANVPDDPPDDPSAGVMRDADTDWDFLDVSRHYLAALYGPEAGDELLPWVSGDVMSEVLGEWRRAASPCGGAFVLWLRDLQPGSGWGLLDHRGRPKAVLAALKAVLAPVAIWTTDEGMSGIAVHVANDRPERLRTTLRVTLYRDYEHRVEEATAAIEVPPHGSWSGDVEALLGRWVDAAYSYRFGEPQHDLVVAALDELSLTAVREPAGRSPQRLDAEALGLEATLDGDRLRLQARRAVLGARAFAGSGELFCVEPGRERVTGVDPARRVVVTARNLAGCITPSP